MNRQNLVKRKAAPPRLWLIVDSDPTQSLVFGWEMTRRAARTQCEKANRLPGYKPSCRVVEYRATETGGEEVRK